MTELGALVGEHRGTPWRFISVATLTGVMTIAAIWASVVMKPDAGGAGMVVMALAILTVVFASVARRDGRSCLAVHERGVIYDRAGVRKEVRFDEIANVRETRVNGRPATLHLELRRGGEVRIATRLENYEHAAHAIASAL